MGSTIFGIFRSLPFRPPRASDEKVPLQSWPLKTGRFGWEVAAPSILFETEPFPQFACLETRLVQCSKTVRATFGLVLTMGSSSTKMAASGVFLNLVITHWVW